MLKSILVTTANGKPQTARSRLPFAVNAMLKVSYHSADTWNDISRLLYRLRVGRVSVDMSTDVSVEGCTKKNMIHERIRTAHLFIKSEELNSQFYENNFESL